MFTYPQFPLLRRWMGAALLVLAAACSPDALAPVHAPAAATSEGVVATEVTGGPALISNSIKYRDSGHKPATGRSGTAVLAARAMLGRNGMTLVEATTGDFETGSAPGQISKVQVKLVTPGGLMTQNHQGTARGGYWSHSFAGQIRASQVQLLANVRGIDGNRTDVVPVQTAVVLRPDLAVSGLTVPASVPVNSIVNVSAVIREMNGDLGARANCVLSVDGVPVDSAAGMWVDAGDAVSCAFLTSFRAIGTRRVTVAARGVTPGDWDDADNAAHRTIEVVSGEVPLGWNLRFSGEDHTFDYHVTYSTWSSTIRQGRVGGQWYRSASLTGFALDQSPLDVPVTFTATLASGETVVGTASAVGAPHQRPGANCQYAKDHAANTSFLMCRYDANGKVDLIASHSSTRAVYYGFYFWGSDGHEYDEDSVRGFGVFPVGSTFGLDVKATDAGGRAWRANGRTPVGSYTEDLSCQWWYGYTCEGWEYLTTYGGSSSGR